MNANHEFPLESAIRVAGVDANAYCLPQTVFRTEETCGWANTNALASFLRNAEMFVTILPARYFA